MSTSSYTRLDRTSRMAESRRVKILLGIILILILLLLFLQRPPANPDGLRVRVPVDTSALEFVEEWKSMTFLNRIYAITPTYARPVQKAELTRISHVVKLAPNVHWIIVEDAAEQSPLVRNLINHAGLSARTTILNVQTPPNRKQKVPNYQQPRGVSQRNLALQWIRDNVSAQQPGVVFFMDDDNTYTVDLFKEMAKISPGRVGVWPVGLVGGLMVERPVLDDYGQKVIGFNSQWRPERPFPVDMAGFAISLDLLFTNKNALFSYEVERGFQETEILRQVTTLDQLQPMANQCREILVWHTRTEAPKLGSEEKLRRMNLKSDDGMEVRR